LRTCGDRRLKSDIWRKIKIRLAVTYLGFGKRWRRLDLVLIEETAIKRMNSERRSEKCDGSVMRLEKRTVDD
jgi:hypothetical protein